MFWRQRVKIIADLCKAVIVLAGVAHVIDLRRQIRDLILKEDPDIVAVELDYGRYYAMTHDVSGKMPYLYRKMGEMQKSLADMLGTEVGEEMLTAIEVANTLGKRVALIDMDASEIARRMKENMGLWEKIRLYASIFLAPFSRKRITKEDVENLIEREDEYIAYLKKKFPGLAKTLFEDREEVMAGNLLRLAKEGKVLAFVGDGHLAGLKRRIPEARVIRLREMMNEGSSVSFSFSVRFD